MPLFGFETPIRVFAFLSLTSKVAASTVAAQIFDNPFYFSLNEWHLATLLSNDVQIVTLRRREEYKQGGLHTCI